MIKHKNIKRGKGQKKRERKEKKRKERELNRYALEWS